MNFDDAYDALGPLALCSPENTEPAGAPAPAAANTAAARPAGGPRPGSRQVLGTDGRDFAYVGVVRLAGRALVECGHEHTNRDWPDGHGRPGATGCAREIIAGAARPATAEHHADRRARAWESLTRSTGFTAPASTIAAAKTTATADAAAYLAAVDTVRAATTN